ncbi:MAG TPA: hypothetical protein PLA68_04195 [Panacibacter sp.]|nr:hypothetical protein [Panacibacter sp.]
MIKKHAVLTGVVISFILMITAISIYPGGSIFNKNSVGFDWSGNFISNLFAEKALNGAENPSRIWAYLGMILLPVSYAIFFNNMSKKLPEKDARNILKYGGVANIMCMFLIVTSLHDIMLNISITLFWTCIIVITVFILKTRLYLFKFLCIVCLLIFYYSIFLWATNDWDLLPVMQKVNFINSTLLILGLEYFTKQEDFAHIKPRTRNTVQGTNR